MQQTMRPTLLIILDGFGYRANQEHNAIAAAYTPFLQKCIESYQYYVLAASGTAVGLPQGYIGNSYVGHTTLGAGRIIKQPITLLSESIANHTFFSNQILLQKLNQLSHTHNRLHIIGLLSDAGVHGHIDHLIAFIQAAHNANIKQIIVHPIVDGRDVPPASAAYFLQKLDACLKTIPGSILGTLHGRFYALDRDKHWDRTQKSYTILTQPHASSITTWHEALNNSYAHGLSDEFLVPIQLTPKGIIQDNDGIIFCTVRPDRARQLAEPFCNSPFNAFPVTQIPLSFFITPFALGDHIQTTVLFPQRQVANTLKEMLHYGKKTIFTIAETEKYAHVTYFFDGNKETTWPEEKRIMIPSLSDNITYADTPCMSAPAITKAVLHSLQTNPKDFYLINYANADMVGHSGNFHATTQAVECLDTQLAQIYEQAIQKMNGVIYIVGDHGKAEDMFDEHNHSVRTAHTTHPVPFFIIGRPKYQCNNQNKPTQLADVAPLILCQMGLPIPYQMQR